MKEAMTVSGKSSSRLRRLDTDGAMLTRSSIAFSSGSSARPRKVEAQPQAEAEEVYNIFEGKKFYLNVSASHAEGLEKDLKRLGATVEGFFSESVNCVISDSVEAWPESKSEDGVGNGVKEERKPEPRPHTPLPPQIRGRGALMLAKLAPADDKNHKSIIAKAKDKKIPVWPVGWVLQYLSELRLKHGLPNIGPRLRFDGQRRKLGAPFVKFQDAHGWSGPTVRENMKLPVLNVNNKLGRGGSVWTSDPAGLPILYPTAQNAAPKPAPARPTNEENRPRRGRPPLKRTLEQLTPSPSGSEKLENPRKRGRKASVKVEPEEVEHKPMVNGHCSHNGVSEARKSEKPQEEQQKRPRGRPRKKQWCEYCKIWSDNYMKHVSCEQHEKAVARELEAPERKKDKKVFNKVPSVEDFYMKRLSNIPKETPEPAAAGESRERKDKAVPSVGEVGTKTLPKIAEKEPEPAPVEEPTDPPAEESAERKNKEEPSVGEVCAKKLPKTPTKVPEPAAPAEGPPESKKDKKVPSVDGVCTKKLPKNPRKVPAPPAGETMDYDRSSSPLFPPGRRSMEGFVKLLQSIAAGTPLEVDENYGLPPEPEEVAVDQVEETEPEPPPEADLDFVFEAGVPISPRPVEEPWVIDSWVWNLEARQSSSNSTLQHFFQPEPSKQQNQRTPPLLRGGRKTTENQTKISPKKSPQKRTLESDFGPASVASFPEALDSVRTQLKLLDEQSAYAFVCTHHEEDVLAGRDERKKRKRGTIREFEETIEIVQLKSAEEYIVSSDGLKLEKEALKLIKRLEKDDVGMKISFNGRNGN